MTMKKEMSNVDTLVALVLASGSKAQTAQGVILAMISSPATVDEVLRTAEKVHQHFASGSLPASKALAAKNNALSILRQQLRRAQAKLKHPLQSFTVDRDGVAKWKEATEKAAVDYVKKASDDLKLAVDAGQVSESVAAHILAILMQSPAEQKEQPTVEQAPRRRRGGANVQAMQIAA
jgi:hypothetical protein